MRQAPEGLFLELALAGGNVFASDLQQRMAEAERDLRVELAEFDGLEGFDLEGIVGEALCWVLRYALATARRDAEDRDLLMVEMRARRAGLQSRARMPLQLAVQRATYVVVSLVLTHDVEV